MNHIHKYKRVKLGESFVVYKCALPGCTHYIREELVVGRLSLCWGCGGSFPMTKTSAERLKPKCIDCIAKTVEKRQLAVGEQMNAKQHEVI